MKEQLENNKKIAAEELAKCGDLKVMEELRVKFLGKKGELTAILKQMGGLSAEERPVIGQLANSVRADIEQKIAERAAALKDEAARLKMEAETIDVTLPGKTPPHGRLHPLTATLERVKGYPGHLLYQRQRDTAHPDLRRSDTHHGEKEAPYQDNFPRACLPFGHGGRHPFSHFQSDRGAGH